MNNPCAQVRCEITAPRHLREGYWESWTATDTTVILTSSCYNEAVICSRPAADLKFVPPCLDLRVASGNDAHGRRAQILGRARPVCWANVRSCGDDDHRNTSLTYNKTLRL